MLVVEEDGGHQRNVDSAPLFGTLSGENLDLVEAGFWGWLQREDGLFVVAFDCYVWKQGALIVFSGGYGKGSSSIEQNCVFHVPVLVLDQFIPLGIVDMA